MPVNGHRVQQDTSAYAYADIPIDLTQVTPSTVDGPVAVGPRPLIPDFTQEQFPAAAVGDQQASLHDIASGNAWLLQRIVGKIHIQCIAGAAQSPADQVWNNVYVTFGLLVARADDDLQSVCDLTALESEPQNIDNMMNPWIFRRSWILGNPSGDGQQWFPTSTAEYGSVADGPHIDSKVKRFISREHRLWMVCTGRGFDPRILVSVGGDAELQPQFGGTFDYRIYGSLRKARNTSSF